MTNMRIRIIAPFLAAALLLGSAVWADPPARVGRLNFLEGRVSFLAGDAEEWTAATLNYPLTAGDGLWADSSSRAEAHVGSTAIRLGAETEIAFLELDDQSVRLRLSRGLLSVRLRELEPGESLAIDTPAMSVSLLTPGSYRIEVTDSGDARAIAAEGRMEAVVDGLAYPARTGQAVFVDRSEDLSIRMGRAPARDGWDRWCDERDEREDRLASIQYVPRSMVGCEDLDWYGSWSLTVEFGPVWTPSSLPAGWAPYRFGHWAWVRPWGWTWIDDMPWGFAPFHYGRWALVHGRWVWVPGARVHRPVYAPALVVFVGSDIRIGWFPLGPREPFVPAYPASRTYIKKVNVTHVEIGDRQTIDASKIRYAHREAGRVYVQTQQQVPQREPQVPMRVAQPRESRPAAARSLLGAIAQLAREWSSGQVPESRAARSREPVVQQGREPRVEGGRTPKIQQKPQMVKVRKKKVLANGQVIWVEEWVAVQK